MLRGLPKFQVGSYVSAMGLHYTYGRIYQVTFTDAGEPYYFAKGDEGGFIGAPESHFGAAISPEAEAIRVLGEDYFA